MLNTSGAAMSLVGSGSLGSGSSTGSSTYNAMNVLRRRVLLLFLRYAPEKLPRSLASLLLEYDQRSTAPTTTCGGGGGGGLVLLLKQLTERLGPEKRPFLQSASTGDGDEGLGDVRAMLTAFYRCYVPEKAAANNEHNELEQVVDDIIFAYSSTCSPSPGESGVKEEDDGQDGWVEVLFDDLVAKYGRRLLLLDALPSQTAAIWSSGRKQHPICSPGIVPVPPTLPSSSSVVAVSPSASPLPSSSSSLYAAARARLVAFYKHHTDVTGRLGPEEGAGRQRAVDDILRLSGIHPPITDDDDDTEFQQQQQTQRERIDELFVALEEKYGGNTNERHSRGDISATLSGRRSEVTVKEQHPSVLQRQSAAAAVVVGTTTDDDDGRRRRHNDGSCVPEAYTPTLQESHADRDVGSRARGGNAGLGVVVEASLPQWDRSGGASSHNNHRRRSSEGEGQAQMEAQHSQGNPRSNNISNKLHPDEHLSLTTNTHPQHHHRHAAVSPSAVGSSSSSSNKPDEADHVLLTPPPAAPPPPQPQPPPAEAEAEEALLQNAATVTNVRNKNGTHGNTSCAADDVEGGVVEQNKTVAAGSRVGTPTMTSSDEEPQQQVAAPSSMSVTRRPSDSFSSSQTQQKVKPEKKKEQLVGDDTDDDVDAAVKKLSDAEVLAMLSSRRAVDTKPKQAEEVRDVEVKKPFGPRSLGADPFAATVANWLFLHAPQTPDLAQYAKRVAYEARYPPTHQPVPRQLLEEHHHDKDTNTSTTTTTTTSSVGRSLADRQRLALQRLAAKHKRDAPRTQSSSRAAEGGVVPVGALPSASAPVAELARVQLRLLLKQEKKQKQKKKAAMSKSNNDNKSKCGGDDKSKHTDDCGAQRRRGSAQQLETQQPQPKQAYATTTANNYKEEQEKPKSARGGVPSSARKKRTARGGTGQTTSPSPRGSRAAARGVGPTTTQSTHRIKINTMTALEEFLPRHWWLRHVQQARLQEQQSAVIISGRLSSSPGGNTTIMPAAAMAHGMMSTGTFSSGSGVNPAEMHALMLMASDGILIKQRTPAAGPRRRATTTTSCGGTAAAASNRPSPSFFDYGLFASMVCPATRDAIASSLSPGSGTAFVGEVTVLAANAKSEDTEAQEEEREVVERRPFTWSDVVAFVNYYYCKSDLAAFSTAATISRMPLDAVADRLCLPSCSYQPSSSSTSSTSPTSSKGGPHKKSSCHHYLPSSLEFSALSVIVQRVALVERELEKRKGVVASEHERRGQLLQAAESQRAHLRAMARLASVQEQEGIVRHFLAQEEARIFADILRCTITTEQLPATTTAASSEQGGGGVAVAGRQRTRSGAMRVASSAASAGVQHFHETGMGGGTTVGKSATAQEEGSGGPSAHRKTTQELWAELENVSSRIQQATAERRRRKEGEQQPQQPQLQQQRILPAGSESSSVKESGERRLQLYAERRRKCAAKEGASPEAAVAPAPGGSSVSKSTVVRNNKVFDSVTGRPPCDGGVVVSVGRSNRKATSSPSPSPRRVAPSALTSSPSPRKSTREKAKSPFSALKCALANNGAWSSTSSSLPSRKAPQSPEAAAATAVPVNTVAMLQRVTSPAPRGPPVLVPPTVPVEFTFHAPMAKGAHRGCIAALHEAEAEARIQQAAGEEEGSLLGGRSDSGSPPPMGGQRPPLSALEELAAGGSPPTTRFRNVCRAGKFSSCSPERVQ